MEKIYKKYLPKIYQLEEETGEDCYEKLEELMNEEFVFIKKIIDDIWNEAKQSKKRKYYKTPEEVKAHRKKGDRIYYDTTEKAYYIIEYSLK